MAGSEAVRIALDEARVPVRLAAAANPYVGPRPLELGEPLWGRDEEVAALYFLLSAERIVVLHSPSGAGKSSLVQAGLIPRLRESFDVWRPTRVNQEPDVTAPVGRPLNRYVHSAILGFEQGIPPALRRPAAELAGLTLAEYAAGRPTRPGAPPSVVVIFDQFEEVLTVDPLAVAAKEAFFDQLGELLHDPRISALFLLREDYLAPLDPYADRVPTHLKNRFRIDLLGLAGAREAIVNPAREGGREFPAADRLVRDLAAVKVQQPDGSFVEQTGNHVEPVQLQVVCRRLWDAMPEDDLAIGVEDLERFGNVDSALAVYYAEAVARIAGGDLRCERAIRDWFGGRLITAGGIRGQALKGVWESEGLANGLVEQLRATHLVRAEKRAGATWCELAHDRLIKPVREDNAAWRERHLSVVQRRAALWESEGRPDGLLLTAEDLADGEAWAAAHEAEITPGERRYLAVSAEAVAAARQEALQARRIRKLAIAATILAVAALIAGGFAGRLWWKAEEQARRTEDLARGGAAASLLETKPSQAALVLLEVRGAEQDAPTVDALHRALAALAGKRDAKTYATLKHDGEVVSASFSPDGLRVVTASEDGTVRLWNAETGRQERVLRDHAHGEVFHSASFSPDADGWRVVTASSDGAAQMWDAATGRKLGGPLSHEKPVRFASFSPDGRRVLTVSGDAARLWDATTGQKLGKPLSHEKAAVRFASFSPDGRRVLTVSGDAARLWDAATGQQERELRGHERGITSASFSDPDGRWVVTASWDGTAQLWDAATGQPAGEPLSHREAVRFASFSPDGTLVVTASRDGTARLWDRATGRLSSEPLRHKDSVRSAAFSPDGDFVVTASDDETARLWEVKTGKEIAILEGHASAVRFASFSADGHRLVTASADGTARLWDLRGGDLDGEALAIYETAKRLSNAAFSPDGARIVTTSRTRGTATILRYAEGGESDLPLWEACGRVNAASFSPDG
ncbi:MAG TPA: WD40 repeat domain-containing protein, partial [Thermoanaerobaculia bacterium]